MTGEGQFEITAVIPAAGRGTRAYPHTVNTPKGLLDVCGRPLLRYTLDLIRDKLGIRRMVIVISPQGEAIRSCFGDGSSLGLQINYVVNDRIEFGPTYSILLARQLVETEYFLVMLSDELYLNSNHEELLSSGFEENLATVTFIPHSRLKDIKKNFSLHLDGRRVVGLVEKPKQAGNRLLGCGTYLFHRSFFDLIQEGYDQRLSDAGDITATLNRALAGGGRIAAFPLRGDYVNLNYYDDLNTARSVVHRHSIARAKVSVIMPCQNDPGIVRELVAACLKQKTVAEMVLVADRTSPELDDLAQEPKIRIVTLPQKNLGYGEIFEAGIKNSSGDLIVLTMDDESFEFTDLQKFLAYVCDAELVLGTRTTRQMIEQGSNMNRLVRTAHVILAKFLEFLWFDQMVKLSDVGCIYRIFWRHTYDLIAEDLRSKRGEYLVEMIIEVLRRRLKIIEIPVNYCRGSEESFVHLRERYPSMFFGIIYTMLRKRFGL